jgi:single-strand DNA-binding protein
MSDMNRVTLIGRLTRDAELKYTASGLAVSKFAVAVNKKVKRGDDWKDEVSYFDIVLFGKMAESIDQYLMKGKQIAIDGEMKQERWDQDGQTRSKVCVIANGIQLLGSKDDGQKTTQAPPQKPKADTSYDDGFVDDIPF